MKARRDTETRRRGDAAKGRCADRWLVSPRVAASPRRRVALAFFVIAFAAPTALAHGGKPHTPRDLLTTWGLEPVVLVSLALAGWLYWRGVRRLWKASAVGLGIRRWEAWCYAGGWLALFVALVSPLHPMGRVLFSAHMTQHEVLMLIAAPLLVMGRPLIAFLWAVPQDWRRRLGQVSKQRWFASGWRVLTLPLVAWAVHAIALWIWHVPSLFDLTNRNEFVHALQHICFLFSALLFWWAVIHGPQRAMGYGLAVLYMFTTAVHSGLLGAMLTFAERLWYPTYQHTTQSWGLTPVEDQELGGLIMWVPAGLVYVFAGLALFVGWLRESEIRAQRNESFALAEVTS